MGTKQKGLTKGTEGRSKAETKGRTTTIDLNRNKVYS